VENTGTGDEIVESFRQKDELSNQTIYLKSSLSFLIGMPSRHLKWPAALFHKKSYKLIMK
jgi:hypothetical protein